MNVSNGGMFVATWRPLPPNALLDLEITRPDGVVRTTARVVHAARYPAEFARVFKSGMGLRFSRPEDPQIHSIAKLVNCWPIEVDAVGSTVSESRGAVGAWRWGRSALAA